jgi:AbrB family looped-hinge helix DNA binding protein
MSYIGRSTMTSKGQITIPSEMREKLGLEPGDGIEFYEGLDGTIKVRVRHRSAGQIVGLLAHLKPDSRYAKDRDAVADEAAARDRRARRRVKAGL